MAAPVAVPNVMLPNTLAKSDDVNENYAAIVSWINANAMQRDGSINFTGIPTLPASNPTLANQAVRKAYVDAFVAQTANIADSAVTTAKIANSAVTSAKIASGAVTNNELASGAVTNSKIADGQVTASKIATNAVTNNEIASNTIVFGNYQDGSIGTAKLADNAVSTSKIQTSAVNTARIADGAVTLSKLAVNAVNTARIFDGSVTNEKMANATGGSLNGGLLFYRRQGNIVHLWTTNESSGGTLPPGFRPSASVRANATVNIGGSGNLGASFVFINTSGSVSPQGGNGYWSCSFEAA